MCPGMRSGRWTLDPAAGEVVAHRHEEHDGEPENRGDDDEMCAPGAVLSVHEEENDAGGLEDSDGEGDDDVQAGEILVEVDFGGGDGESGADHEHGENDEVDFG